MKLKLIAFILFFSCNLKAQNLSKQIERIITSNIKDADGPGLAVLVAKNGKPIFKKAYGYANLELNVPMHTDHVFQIGSMTKQFTAIAILMLEEQGLLSVQDALSKFIPEYPNASRINIHQLLTHTAGLPDITKFKGLREFAQTDHDAKELIEFFKSDTLEFQPGSKFSYSNTGYVLLGYIIELCSGMKYDAFIQKNIFDKLGMKSSRYSSDRLLVENRADGYHKKVEMYVNKNIISYSIPFASGALMSNLDDLLKWQNALRDQVLLKEENSMKAFSNYNLSNGDAFTYGYGWHIKEINGQVTREHGGSVFGYKSMAVYFPEKDIYLLGLSNCDCISPTQLIRELAALITAQEK